MGQLGGSEWDDLLSLRKFRKLIDCIVNVTDALHVRSDLVEITQNLEVFLRLLVQLLAELRHVQ